VTAREQPSSSPRRTGLLYAAVLALGLLGVSHGAIFARMADAHPLVIAFWRVAIAAAILAPIAWAPFAWAGRGSPVTRRALAATALAGLFLALHFATWITSLELTTIANSVFLVTTCPLWIVLYRVLRGETRLTGTVLASTLASIAGTAVIAAGGSGLSLASWSGDALALAGGVMMAAYLLAGTRARASLPLLPYLSLCYAFAAFFLAIAVALAGPAAFDLPAGTWAALAAMALVSQIAGHGAYNWALAKLNPNFVAVCLLGEPIMASALSLAYFGEPIPPATLLGGPLILLGIYLGSRAETA
jgi:drug/metabolite transporter (DMT)-like permease